MRRFTRRIGLENLKAKQRRIIVKIVKLDPKTKLDLLMSSGVDIDNRYVYVSDIDEESVLVLTKLLQVLDDGTEITFFIGSLGGCVYSMFQLYETIQMLDSPVSTYAVGVCMSSAVPILAAGQKGERYCSPTTTFMVHEGQNGEIPERLSSAQISIEQEKKLLTQYCDVLAKHSGLTSRQWNSKCKKLGDTYFTADSALKWGIVDHILGVEVAT